MCFNCTNDKSGQSEIIDDNKAIKAAEIGNVCRVKSFLKKSCRCVASLKKETMVDKNGRALADLCEQKGQKQVCTQYLGL